ncbi:Transcription factor IIIC, subunit 5 [Beauveria brongniartii RCEF 3172]|uniref:Transcription factor IIIC, subunit 5 n=1 Tax=Beauveria brongniartii RCEF 3172 TaxID=1081107 RepID=A0A167A141_9HYPO|nr:Transcription factor IIIC, subunit 5 [Beauveria brongniartii RCEF 3172]
MTSHSGNGKEASASDYSLPGSTVPGPSSTRDASSQNAPIYLIPNRKIAAVEIPAVVQNIDRAISAFGRVPSFEHVLDPQRNSVPLYLNPESPFCNPIMSHNAASHNVVLKITLPKRTGRKRKRGSSTAWEGDQEICDADQANPVCSIARQDEPKILKRKLQDNVGRYKVDAVGVINHTHRYRGFADFYWDMSTSSFTNRYVDQVFSGDVEKMKAFTLEPGIDKSRNSDVIPPPLFTHMSLPFNYLYSQNPYVRTTADGGTVNVTAVKQVGYFISADEPTPTGPQEPPDVTDARFMEVLADLEAAFEDRPIWTRRSLLNHLGKKLDSWNELKKYLNYAAYQFKGGPWRDCVVPYGLDPRTHPKYREYQTLMFKLTKHKRPSGPATVRTYRRPEKIEERQVPAGVTSHIFDGETYDTDGKVWQVCDITDPLLRELLDGAAVRSAWDISSGWYHGGLWAKVKAIMKTKLVGIRFGRQLTRADFVPTLQFGDMTPPRSTSTNLHLPLPNLRLTDEELIALRGRKPPKKKSQGYNVRLLGLQATSTTDDPTSVASSPSRAPMEAMENDEDSVGDSNEENDSGSEIEDDQLDQLADEYSGQDYNGPEYSAPYNYEFGGGRLSDADYAEDVYPELE